MPKERIYGAHIDGTIEKEFDASVQWGKLGQAYNGHDGYVYLAAVEKCDARAETAVLLDRDGVNRLIRVLRRARDQAFGADA